MGHPNSQVLSQLSSIKAISISKSTKAVCESCRLGKSSSLPFSASKYVASRSLERVHCDLWGPSPTVSAQGFHFYVIFIDNWSHFCWFYPLKFKSDFYETFLLFQTYVENQFGCKIGSFQCDGGGEFMSNKFLLQLKFSGIQQLISCPHTPQQNGLAERKHRHLMELGLSMMFERKMPQKIWVEALYTAKFLINLLPTSALDSKQRPYQKLYSKSPDYTSLRTFGCAYFPTLRAYASNKFDPRSLKCVFLGYNDRYKFYRCLYPPTGRVYISRHVMFDETLFPFSDIYSSLHPSGFTPLMRAWQQTFASSSANTSVSPISTTELIPISSTLPPAAPPLFTDADFPPLPSLSHYNASSLPVTPANSLVAPADSRERSERTTDLDPRFIGDRSSNDQSMIHTTTPLQSEAQPVHQAEATHPIITRAKDGISKPNKRYVLLAHKVAYPEPKTIARALKDPG